MSEWRNRAFGDTGLEVSALGFGAGHIGSPDLSEKEVAYLLDAVLDAGITLVDTARGYGLSEERIGRHLSGRRAAFVLSTKIGYDIPGLADWTGATITAGVDAALTRLQTDYLDIVHLHSCSLEVLEAGEVIEALTKAVEDGKVRVAAYSGDNEPLEWAAANPAFGSVQTSFNICNQRVIAGGLALAQTHHKGLIAKRPAANAPWRFATRPVGDYSEIYWERWQAMQLDPGPYEWQELALRFAVYQPGVSSAIIGTGNLSHLRHDVALVERGPLPADVVANLYESFQAHDQNWRGEI